MRYLSFILLFNLSIAYSQVVVDPWLKRNETEKWPEERMEKFLNTTTVFVFSNIYERNIYESILENTWTITEYEIISDQEFSYENLLNKEHSFAYIDVLKAVQETGSGYNTRFVVSFEISMFNTEKLDKKLMKVVKSGNKERLHYFLGNSTEPIARIFFEPNLEYYSLGRESAVEGNVFKTEISQEHMDKLVYKAYNEDVLLNYSPGYLKNYLLFINDKLKKKEIVAANAEIQNEGLTRLNNETLYISPRIKVKRKGIKLEEEVLSEKQIARLLKAYTYSYNIASDEELEQMLLEGEDKLYLRFFRTEIGAFFEVANAKTGEIYYRDFMSFINITWDRFRDLKEAIDKEVKLKKKKG